MRVPFGLLALLAIGCTTLKPERTTFEWGEVFYGQKQVCTEVEVRRIDIDQRNGGRVQVTLHNHTNARAAVQVALEILSAKGARLDYTNYNDVAVAPYSETIWDMPGLYRKGAKVRVLVRKR